MESLKQIKELWRYRELAIEQFWLCLKLRYVGSWLGFFWTLLNPVLYIFTYWIVFSQIIKMGLPDYPLFLIPGFLAWNFTLGSLIIASESIINYQALITKISFPFEILTLANVAVFLFDFIVSLSIYLVAIAILPPKIPLTAIALPLVIIIQVLLTTGFAMVLACISVFFRDIPSLVPVLGTMIFFVTPVIYPLSFVPESIQPIIKLNPMTQILVLYHSLLYEKIWPNMWALGSTFIIAIVIFIVGFWVFNRNRHKLSEIC